jgi:hypothetical protein
LLSNLIGYWTQLLSWIVQIDAFFTSQSQKGDSAPINKALENKSKTDQLMVNNLRNENQKVKKDVGENFNDSPGAIVVNLLTSAAFTLSIVSFLI